MKHTELPWRDDGAEIVGVKQQDIIAYIAEGFDAIGESEANAAFIVKAVNNHYQLLEALGKISRQTEDKEYPYRAIGADQMMRIAREAIKAAEES